MDRVVTYIYQSASPCHTPPLCCKRPVVVDTGRVPCSFCLSVYLFVCKERVLWKNGRFDQDAV